jgi:hypothetical protein
MESLTCKILPNGNLRVTANNAMRASISEGLKTRGYWSTMADAFESYSCNGGFTAFDAGEANPFVGLTSAPCVAESMSYDDDGQAEIDGRLWAFTSYATHDPLEELATRGRAEYDLVRESAQ